MDRKQIVSALQEHLGAKAKYKGAPSFAYQIEKEGKTYTIDREGRIWSEQVEVTLESILKEKESDHKPTTENADTQEHKIIKLRMDEHTGRSLRNFINMIYSKQHLIRKSLGVQSQLIDETLVSKINDTEIETLQEFQNTIGEAIQNSSLEFDFDKTTILIHLEGSLTIDEIDAFNTLINLVDKSAKAQRHASFKVKETENEKYAFRVWLIRLGMIGDEYKEARKVLLKDLSGNSAFSKKEEVAK